MSIQYTAPGIEPTILLLIYLTFSLLIFESILFISISICKSIYLFIANLSIFYFIHMFANQSFSLFTHSYFLSKVLYLFLFKPILYAT